MRYAVLSLCANERDRDYSSSSWTAVKRYCQRFGFDHVFTDFETENPWEAKFNLITEYLKAYDRVLYVEPCTLIRTDCLNVFELVPEDRIGMFDEGDINPSAKAGHAVSALYNSDVIVASKEHLGFFSPFEQQTNIEWKFFKLPHRFNRTLETLNATGEPMEDSFIANLGKSSIGRMRELSETFNHYRQYGTPVLRKRILIDMPGALGDCIAMEPVVRYVATVLEPEAIIRVRTQFGEAFNHLLDLIPDCRFLTVPDDPKKKYEGYCHINLAAKLPHCSFNLMHPVDYGSLCAFGGHLPDTEKGIKLQSDFKFPELWDHILIHPGASWPSKTFPVEYWQEIIDDLIDSGRPVALIGKTYSDGVRGTVPVDGSRCRDLRDKLGLPELIAAIRDSRMLISNDSSPIHIAGAFLNPAIMITSCKQSEFIWPKRERILNITLGSPLPNAYPKIGLANSTRIDECSPEELKSILPSPEIVLRELESYFAGD